MAWHTAAKNCVAGREMDEHKEQINMFGLGRRMQPGKDIVCCMSDAATAFLKALT